ncbi:ABC1 domain containing protein [Diplocarpon rosae]|nr:ABC1 domain containing protein [Diplocarpon rosae]
MFQRDETLPSSSCIHAHVTADQFPPVEETYANDDFDDVFGSAPSPSLGPSGNLEPSDIPRLKEKHETEGYRDGVTKGKGESVQKGFDEGYGLGAVLGLRIGKILGLLEGVLGGLKGVELEGEKGRVEALLEQAKRDLGTRCVFEREFWGEDGIWRFEVPGEREADGDVVFPDVAAAHPLVRKWEGVLEEEVRRWGLDLGIFDGENGELEEGGGGLVGKHAKEANGELESENVAEGLAKVMGIEKKDLCW